MKNTTFGGGRGRYEKENICYDFDDISDLYIDGLQRC